MSVQAFNRRVRVWVEGVLCPFCVGVNISSRLNSPINASISLVDDGLLRSTLIEGTRVAIFLQTQDEVFLSDEEKNDFVLVFEGHVSAISYMSGSSGKTIILTCQGWSSYCAQALFFFSRDIDVVNKTVPQDPASDPGKRDYFDRSIFTTTGFELDDPVIANSGTNSQDPIDNTTLYSYSEQIKLFKQIAMNSDPANRSEDQTSGIINLVQNCYYHFAYSSESRTIARDIYETIFSSVNISSKVWGVEDTITTGPGGTFPESDSRSDDERWFTSYLNNVIGQMGYISSFYDLMMKFMEQSSYFYSENPFPSYCESGKTGPVYTFIRPDIFFSVPPSCNVIFPKEIESLSEERNFSSEPNLHLFIKNGWKQDGSFNDIYDLNSGRRVAEQDPNIFQADIALDQKSLPGIERLTGIKPYISNYSEFLHLLRFEENPNTFNDSIFAAGSGDSTYLNSAKRLAIYKYWRDYFSSRNLNVNLTFCPFLVLGQTCMIIQETFVTSGLIDSMQHSLLPSGFSTSISVSKARTNSLIKRKVEDAPNNFFSGLTDKYNGSSITKIYQKFFGTEAMYPVGSNRPSLDFSNPKEMDKYIVDCASDLHNFYYSKDSNLSKSETNNWADKYRKRSFTSEKKYFENLGFSNVEQHIRDGIFPSVGIFEIGSGKPYSVERQIPIVDYVNNIYKNKSVLRASNNG